MPTWDNATSRRVEDTSAHEDMEMGSLGTGAGAQGPHTAEGGYSQILDQPDSHYGNGPAEYRGANMTHPYGSDLGTRRLGAEDTGHTGYASGPAAGTSYAQDQPYAGRSQQVGRNSYGAASAYASSGQPGYFQQEESIQEARFPTSSPAPTYQTYAPIQTYSRTDSARYAPTTAMGSMSNSPTQVRPPSLLQVGRKPLPGSGREV